MNTDTTRADWLVDEIASFRESAANYAALSLLGDGALAADHAKRAGIFAARADEAQGDLDDLIAEVAA